MPRKRAASGSGTQPRLRADGRWECKFCAGRDPGTGKLIRRSVYGATSEEAAKKLRAAVAALDAGEYVEPSRMTVKDWLETWLAEYCDGVKASSRRTYEIQLRVHIIPSLGAKRLCELRAHDVQKFVNALHRGSKTAPGVSAKTVKNDFGILHRALAQAVRIGYLKANPADGCILPRVEKAEIQPLDDAAIGRFLSAIKGHENEQLFIVDLFTGLRKSELLGLTWDCLDLDVGTLRVYRQLQFLKGEYSFQPLKNDKPRLLYPSRFVMDAFKEQKRLQAAQRLKAGACWNNPEGFVFTNEIGGHLLHQTIYKRFKRIAAEIGMPDARFHDLRHSYAVAALKHGDDVKTVQENLGHASASFTLDTYGHATDEMKRASAARMDATIEGILQNQRA